MSIVSIRHLAVASLAALLAACGGDQGGETGDAAKGDSAQAASGEQAKAAQPAVKPPREDAPRIIRGLYVNAYKAGSGTHRRRLIEIADQTEINAFVIDMKDERGLHYVSTLTLQNELTEDSEITIRNPRAFVDTMKAHNIYLIARIVVFKDPILSKAQSDWSVRNPSGGLWVDKAGNTWVSPWDERVWDYNLDIRKVDLTQTYDWSDPVNEFHQYWEGWFEMQTLDGKRSSTMNGERMWVNHPTTGQRASEAAGVKES